MAPVIAAGSFYAAADDEVLAGGRADLIAFGRPFLANPALANVFAAGGPILSSDPAFHYSPGAEGYLTD